MNTALKAAVCLFVPGLKQHIITIWPISYLLALRSMAATIPLYMNLLISLFDRTGNQSRPYRENGWEIVQIDIQNGKDILKWNYEGIDLDRYRKIGVLAPIPCTDYATSGAKHFSKKDELGYTKLSDILVTRTYNIIQYLNPFFWQVENPRTRLHKLHPWIGQRPKLVFNPCDFAGYDPNPDDSRYNKETWLFGKFNDPVKKYLPAFTKDNLGWRNLGGKSLETKNARSITPLGFAYAFYEANH